MSARNVVIGGVALAFACGLWIGLARRPSPGLDIPKEFRGEWQLTVYASSTDYCYQQGKLQALFIGTNVIHGHRYSVLCDTADVSVRPWRGIFGDEPVTLWSPNGKVLFLDRQRPNGDVRWRGVYVRKSIVESAPKNDRGWLLPLACISGAKAYWGDFPKPVAVRHPELLVSSK